VSLCWSSLLQRLHNCSYAGNYVRHLDANINATFPDFVKKAVALFRYAEYDEHMVS
jgi:hypothetical protein